MFGDWTERVVAAVEDEQLRSRLQQSWMALSEYIDSRRHDLAALLADGREVMFSLAWVVTGILLAHDAQRDGQNVAMEITRRWILDGEGGVGEHLLPAVADIRATAGRRVRISDRDRINWDCRIVWGVDLPNDAAAGYRQSAPKPDGKKIKLAL